MDTTYSTIEEVVTDLRENPVEKGGRSLHYADGRSFIKQIRQVAEKLVVIGIVRVPKFEGSPDRVPGILVLTLPTPK